MERKKRAATAMDSISAEDVGKFPDQNVNEAISRVAGVALDRGENGEGRASRCAATARRTPASKSTA